jgi:hypothetical protein
MTGGLVRTEDEIMPTKGLGSFDSDQFAPLSFQIHRNKLVRSPIPRTPQKNGPPTATIAFASICATSISGSCADFGAR